MFFHRLSLFVAAAALGLATCQSALAQDVSPVTPVSVPIPLPGNVPVAPPLLRTSNPSVLPMTGTWRFALTHGRIVAGGNFVGRNTTVTASSEEGGNSAVDAFDGKTSTRWCADGSSYPQWLEADLGRAETVRSVELKWERSAARYDYRLQGSSDGKAFVDLGSRSEAPAGSSDGTAQVTEPKPFRYFRVLVTAGEQGWASIRECKITIAGADGAADTVWKPSAASVPDSERDAFAAPDYGDSDWHDLSVPSNWEMAGYSIPTYNSVDNTVGLYRRTVSIPASFAGKRVIWRFDGVLDGAEIWVNGHRAGYHESGYTSWDIDVTDFLKPGEKNLFAVRVSKSTPSVDCETGDFQCMGGIYRENYLIAVPETHVQTLRVETKLDAAYHDATLITKLVLTGVPGSQVTVSGDLAGAGGARVPQFHLKGEASFGPDGHASLTLEAPVAAPRLWSAEKPNLYYVILTLSTPGHPAVERVQERFGFRQVEIKNGVVLWNGRPIKCTGVCRHDEWADKGFALTEANWRKDLALMRAANVNAIRTSHYNHAERFVELCDEMGFYILDEIPFCWINEKFSDPTFTPYLLQRADETIARDQNKACVLAWSIGNENGHGSDGQAVIDRVIERDPTRPRFVSQMWPGAYKGQSLRDSHYPEPADIVGLVSGNGENAAPASFSENPHIFWQPEAHSYDPGVSDLWGEALQNAWNLIWPEPTILGSFIWEWQNQGIADPNPDKTRDFYQGTDHLRQENNKGVVDAYRNPKAEYAYVRMVYSPIGFGGVRAVTPINGISTVPLENRYSFTDLNELKCRATALAGDRTLVQGERALGCAPGQTIAATFPTPAGATALHLDFIRPDGSSVIAVTLPVAGAKPALPALATDRKATLSLDADMATITIRGGSGSVITFDRYAGTLKSWSIGNRTLVTSGPIVNLGEARKPGDAPKDYLYGPEPPRLEISKISWQRLDDAIQVITAGRVRGPAADHPEWGSLFITYTIHARGNVDVDWKLYWTGKTAAHAWEAGLKFLVPKDLTRMRWSRVSQFSDYPAGHQGAPTGECTAASDADAFRAAKRDLQYLSLTGASGEGLALTEEGGPLVGRAALTPEGVELFASREVASPRDFTYPYVSEHDISLSKNTLVSGKFCLYPIGIKEHR